MSLGIILRPKAHRDLIEIWNYTQESWGADQAETYVNDLKSAIERVADHPGFGSVRDYVRPGLRKLTVGSHAVYYFHDERVLRVVRILHISMDIERAL